MYPGRPVLMPYSQVAKANCSAYSFLTSHFLTSRAVYDSTAGVLLLQQLHTLCQYTQHLGSLLLGEHAAQH